MTTCIFLSFYTHLGWYVMLTCRRNAIKVHSFYHIWDKHDEIIIICTFIDDHFKHMKLGKICSVYVMQTWKLTLDLKIDAWDLTVVFQVFTTCTVYFFLRNYSICDMVFSILIFPMVHMKTIQYEDPSPFVTQER